MVHAEALGLVKRQQDSGKEDLMLLFEGEGETVDDGSKNLEEFGNAVKTFGFIGELEEYVVDGSSNEGSEVQELAVDTVQGCLEEITLTRVLGIKEL
jgi:hypothetical protein